MNLTILTLILLPISALLIYLLVKRFTKNNYPSNEKEKEKFLVWNDNILDVDKNSRIILRETIIPRNKEIDPSKKKYPRKKTSSSPSIAIDELPKSNELPKDKKSSPKKSYYKKKKSSKKDKGDNLLLS